MKADRPYTVLVAWASVSGESYPSAMKVFGTCPASAALKAIERYVQDEDAPNEAAKMISIFGVFEGHQTECLLKGCGPLEAPQLVSDIPFDELPLHMGTDITQVNEHIKARLASGS